MEGGAASISNVAWTCPVESARVRVSPAAQAAVSRPQSRFEGSARQARGRLMAALVGGPVDPTDVAAVIRWSDVQDRASAAAVIVDGLVRDGLVELAEDGMLVLPR